MESNKANIRPLREVLESLQSTTRFSIRCWLKILCCGTLLGCSPKGITGFDNYRHGGAYSGTAPSPSPDGDMIVYSSPRTGNGDIYRVKIDGTMTVRLTDDEKFECSPEYSRDARKIVFVRCDERNEGDLWLINADGSNQRFLTQGNGDEGGPRFSFDGAQVFFWRTVPELVNQVGAIGAREVFVIDVTTAMERRLTFNNVEDVFPAVSPDGGTVALTKEMHVWIMNPAGKGGRSLGKGSEPSFSPDGKRIVCVSGEYGRGIDVMNVDGSDRDTIYSNNTTISHPVFMPNGEFVLFLESSDGRGVGNIRMVKLHGTDLKQVHSTQ